MQQFFLTYFLFFIFFPSLHSLLPSTLHRTYSSINPYSLREQLIFATLYHNSEEGKADGGQAEGERAKQQIEHLLNYSPIIPEKCVSPFLRTTEHLFSLTSPLPSLPVEGFDLAKALLTQQEVDAIDLLARAVLIKVGTQPSKKKLVEAINSLLFFDLNYRFPAHKESEIEIDRFSLLSSVIELRQGVCLGTSALYLAIGQRVGLELYIYTPPGHIFIAWKDDAGTIHPIETTCRGVYVPMESYMGVHLQKIPPRTLQEVVGLSHFNKAATHLRQQDWEGAEACYEKTLLHIQNDPLTLTLLAATRRLQGKEVSHQHVDFSDLLSHDLAHNFINQEGLRVALAPLDEKPQLQIDELQNVLLSNPKSLFLRQQLASLFISQERWKNASMLLQSIHMEVPNHLPILYYLCALHYAREQDHLTISSCGELLKLLKKKSYQLPSPILDLFQAVDARCGTSLTRDAYAQLSPLRFHFDDNCTQLTPPPSKPQP